MSESETSRMLRSASFRWIIRTKSRKIGLIYSILSKGVLSPSATVKSASARRERWWQFADHNAGLYATAIARATSCPCRALSPHIGDCCDLPTGMILRRQLVVFAYLRICSLRCLQSRAHEIWARFFALVYEG